MGTKCTKSGWNSTWTWGKEESRRIGLELGSADKLSLAIMLQLQKVTYSIGALNILDAQDLRIEDGERVALVGRNGAGKTTLMRLLAGEMNPQSGELIRQGGIRCAFLDQEFPQELQGTLKEIVIGGEPNAAAALQKWNQCQQAMEDGDSRAAEQLVSLSEELQRLGAWEIQTRADQLLDQLDLDGNLNFQSLSGGMKRRTMLARALVSEPDYLFLDEPTNHLDIPAITQLEDFLLSQYRGTLFFVSHDRAFLRRLATRIIELDRGRLYSYEHGYAKYLEVREERLRIEADQNALFDKRLAEEERWIRRGIEARRTRNMGRVRRLYGLREERSARRELEGKANLQVQSSEASGRLVVHVRDLNYDWDDKPFVKDLSLRLMRGDRLGILGPNGCGKTTLLRLLLGQLEPKTGLVEQGTRLEVSYFDQLRVELDPNLSAQDNLGVRGDFVDWNGEKRHILSYLQDFLFTPERARTPVGVLSGGERNRLLLARHFLKPANVMVMDEPTNDLDVETLDLLQELLAEWPGTLLLVSHDRAFLDEVVTSTLVYQGEGDWKEYVGGYKEWMEQGGSLSLWRPAKVKKEKKVEAAPVQQSPAPSKKKLSFKEQREYDELPARLEKLEAQIAQFQADLADPSIYANHQKVDSLTVALDQAQKDQETLMERWMELEERA